MGNITSNGYPDYPRVAADVELPNEPAPEKTHSEYTGDDESWKGGPKGLQPGFDIPGVPPMSPGFSSVFGPQAG